MSKVYISHHESRTRLYEIWCGVIKRCENTNAVAYKNYGGRGIKICTEWRNSYPAFRQWAIGNGYREALTLERNDTNGDYCPENCSWIAKSKQPHNTRVSKHVIYQGRSVPPAVLARELGLPEEAFRTRVTKLGWDIELAITTPFKKYRDRH